MTKAQQLNLAIQLASTAHANQKERDGRPYVGHSLRVMEAMPTNDFDARAVAVLHDVVEDTLASIDDLIDAGFSIRVVEAVRTLTISKGEHYTKYIENISKCPLATRVKLADLMDNMDITRLPKLGKRDNGS